MSFPLIISIKSSKISKFERENIKKYKPFGIILFKRNILNFNQTKKLIKTIKSLHPKIYILIDQEGGIVNRFSKIKEFNFLDNFDYYKIYLKYPSLAKQLVYLKSFITSYHLNELGFDINTIPVLDIPNSKTIQMIKKRTFGSELDTSIKLNEIFVKTSISLGITPVMKHIPGHGLTSKDSHLSLPTVSSSLKTLNDQLKLFYHFRHLPYAMTAHIRYDKWDIENMATYSKKIIHNIIRQQIKFKGLIMSDDMTMKANQYDIKESIIKCNQSGVDIFLDCSSDWGRYLEIIESFKVTSRYKNLLKINRTKRKADLKSINIIQYHDLYNELIKLYGI